MNKAIMIVGVGGQGTLLASRILGSALLSKGYDVKVSEVHGMSQRGGSVVTYVKYGEKVYSPVIGEGEADLILAFEQLESARWLSCLKPDGKIIVNTQKIDPMSVVIGDCAYPENIIDSVKASGAYVEELDALPLAVEAGSAKAVNVVLIGAMAKIQILIRKYGLMLLRRVFRLNSLNLILKHLSLVIQNKRCP